MLKAKEDRVERVADKMEQYQASKKGVNSNGTIYMAKKPKEDGTEEFTLPDELQNQIKAGADAAGQMPKLIETLNGLKSIMETQSKAQKDKEDAEAAAALRLKNSKKQEEFDAEIEESCSQIQRLL